MSKLAKLLIATNLVIWSVVGYEVAQAAEKEKVCVDVKDAKTGKTKQECKEIKKHKKLEGTKVPEKK
jgi:hypothetical protein